jgi:hypothetical protein
MSLQPGQGEREMLTAIVVAAAAMLAMGARRSSANA